MSNLAPPLKSRFWDVNNAQLAGGKLYSYIAGTTTPLATYTDASGLTPNQNPIILDATGQADVWLGDFNYKFVLTDANGATQWTQDNVKGLGKAIADEVNVAGALSILNNLSDLNNPVTALVNLGIAPFQYPTRFAITNNQSATNLSGETFDGGSYTSVIYEYEIQQSLAGYLFTVAAANATSGATYTNNGHTFTVTSTISGAIKLFCSGTSAPLTSGVLTKSGGTGDATITFTAIQPLYSIFGNGSFQVEFINGVWTIVKRADFDNGTPHGVSFSVTQAAAAGQLLAAEGGLGNAVLKLKKHFFFT